MDSRWSIPLVAALCLVHGCGEASFNEVVVVVDTVLCPADYDRIDVIVTAGGVTEQRCAVLGRDEEGCVRVAATDLPLTMSVVSASGQGNLVARAELRREGSMVACRAMRSSFTPDGSAMLRIEVARACGGLACDEPEVVETERWIGSPPPRLECQPPSVAPELPIRRIGAGAQHACLIDGMNRLFCWGENEDSQLAVGDRVDRFRPTLVPVLTDVIDVEAGDRHTCVATGSGSVLCWGDNNVGQVGNGSRAGNVVTPFETIAPGAGAVAVALGPEHSCALLDDGTVQSVQCWGSNGFGEAGGAPNPVLRPTAVMGLPDALSAVTAGGGSRADGPRHSCALDGAGAALCWGSNQSRELGVVGATEARTALMVETSTTFSAIAAGSNETCGVATDARIVCWGRNLFPGTLGMAFPPGSMETQFVAPGPIDATLAATSIAAGDTWRCIVTTEGMIRCFGNEIQQRLGQTNEMMTFVDPAEVPTPAGVSFQQVALGAAFACALPATGSMPVCWGDNASGQLGLGAPGRSAGPGVIPLCN